LSSSCLFFTICPALRAPRLWRKVRFHIWKKKPKIQVFLRLWQRAPPSFWLPLRLSQIVLPSPSAVRRAGKPVLQRSAVQSRSAVCRPQSIYRPLSIAPLSSAVPIRLFVPLFVDGHPHRLPSNCRLPSNSAVCRLRSIYHP
jgi:hypothetical protein